MSEEQNPQEQAYVLPDIPQHIQDLVNEYKAEVLKPWEWDQKDIGVSGLDEWSASNGASWYYMDRPIGGIYEGKEYRWHTFNGRGMNPGEIAIFVSWREPDLVTYGPQAFESGFAFGYAGRPKLTVRPVVTLDYYIHPENGWHPVGIDELMLDSMMGESGRYSDEDRSEMMAALDALTDIVYHAPKPEELFSVHCRFSEWLDKAQKKRPRRRPRKAAAQDEKALFSNSKAERFIFGEGSKAIGPEAYDGREMLLDLGRLKAQTPMRLKDSALDLRAIPADSLGVTWLTSKERYWLTMAQSTWRDNRDSKVTYGSDILKHAGYSNPLKRGMAATMREAAEALTRLTHIHIWLDTTGEDASYKRRAVRRISDRRIVDGRVSLEEYEDGTCDFVIEWQAVDGDTPFPLMDYAQDKGEAFVVPSEAFKFPRACGQISDNVRRALVYIYRQAASKGLSDTVLFDTMLPALGLDGMSSSALGRFRASLKKALDDWKERSPQVITSWCWKPEGCKIVGITVHANRRYLAQTQELVEAENMKKDGPLLPPEGGK
jgi:hypothetical protein